MRKRKKLIMERRRRRILSGVLAVLLVVALAVGLMPNEQVYAAEKTSDGNTTGSYAQNLGDNSSTRYAGRVWTDKTVYTEDATFPGDVGNVTVKRFRLPCGIFGTGHIRKCNRQKPGSC